MRKGFIAGILVGGLVGAYYGMQLTTREKSELKTMAMRMASRGRRVFEEAKDTVNEEVIDELMD